MILDGYGLNDRHDGNAVYEAKTPVMDGLMKDYPFVKGNASGLAVGLPDGQMGNSEVGHMNMGAGRIVYQELTRITKEIPYRTARFLSFIFFWYTPLLFCYPVLSFPAHRWKPAKELKRTLEFISVYAYRSAHPENHRL